LTYVPFFQLLVLTIFFYQANENDDGDDDESLDELMELLQASSESHADDDAAWANLRKEIIQRRDDYVSGESARKVGSKFHALCCIMSDCTDEINLLLKPKYPSHRDYCLIFHHQWDSGDEYFLSNTTTCRS